jgi:hypothetical protein
MRGSAISGSSFFCFSDFDFLPSLPQHASHLPRAIVLIWVNNARLRRRISFGTKAQWFRAVRAPSIAGTRAAITAAATAEMHTFLEGTRHVH